MKTSKVCQQLITKQKNFPQKEHTLSADEFDRLTAYVSLLIDIDRKNKAKNKKAEAHEQS